MLKKITGFITAKFFKINDSPQKIALGVGLGIFSGLLPGAGPIAALFLAFIFKANRAAALLGSMLTNTWISIVTFVLAIKVGSAILNLNWLEVNEKAQSLTREFNLAKLFKLSFFDLVLPVLAGYIFLGLVLGLVSYLVTLLIIRRKPNGIKTIHP
jgi:hypothetical protein